MKLKLKLKLKLSMQAQIPLLRVLENGPWGLELLLRARTRLDPPLVPLVAPSIERVPAPWPLFCPFSAFSIVSSTASLNLESIRLRLVLPTLRQLLLLVLVLVLVLQQAAAG